MANLSNINGKFVVDTAGNIGVGTLIPRSDANTTNISIQSSGTARLFVNNTGASGKEYAIYSSANGDFGIFDYGAVSARLVIDSSGNSTFAGNVKLTDEKILGLRTSTNDYALQYRDLDFRLIGSADGTTQRKFSFGYYTSDNPAGTWNGKTYINSYTGNVGINVANPGFQAVDAYGQIGIEIKGAKESNQAPCLRLHETGSGKGSFELRSNRDATTSGNYFAIAEGTDTFFAIRGDDDGGGVVTRGYVGIGTTSPDEKLDVAGKVQVTGTSLTVLNASDPSVAVSSTDTNYKGIMTWRNSGSENILEFVTRHGGTYYTNNLVLDRGKVGIGTTDIEETLTIAKSGGGDGTIVGLRSDASFSQFEIATKNSQIDWGLQTIGARNMYFTTNGVERMRIDSLGIVTVTNTGAAVLKLQAGTNNSASLRLINDAHDWDVNCQTNDRFAIYSHTDTTERLVILPTSGNVGIGTTSPQSKLHVNGGGINLEQGGQLTERTTGVEASAAQNTWYAVHTFNIYELTLFFLLVGFEDDLGDGNNKTAVFVDSGTLSYGSGFAPTRLSGSTSIEARRAGQELQIRFTHTAGGSNRQLRWSLITVTGN